MTELSPMRSKPQAETPAPNAPAPDALCRAITRLEAALRELDEGQRPAHRLSSAIAELEAAEHRLTEFRARDDAALAAWVGDGAEGPRPEPSPATLDTERRIAQLNRDGAAARAALPAVEARCQALAERVRTLHRERDEAAYWAAVDAARDYAQRWREKLLDALRDEATLRSLHNELLTIGNLGDGVTAALGAAKAIADLINKTRRGTAVPYDRESGRRLISALMTDPTASL